MAPDDYEYDDTPEEEEGSSEDLYRHDSDVEDTSEDIDYSDVIEVEPEQSSDIIQTIYEGKPTQANKAKGTPAPRHNIIKAEAIYGSGQSSGSTVVTINIKPTGAGPQWDFVVNLTDVTSGTYAAQPDQVDNNTTLNHIQLSYYTVSGGASSPACQVGAHTRNYEATFNSGHVEDFSILVPGYYNSVGYYFSQYTFIGNTTNEVYPCADPNPDFRFHVGRVWSTVNAVSGNLLELTQIDVIDDPSNLWTNGASLVQFSSGKPVEFTLMGNGGIGSDNFYLANVNGGGTASTYNVDPNQFLRQKVRSIVAIIDDGIHPAAPTAFAGFNTIPNSGLNWSEVEYGFGPNQWFTNYNVGGNFPFVSFIEYAEHLPDCDPTTFAIDACLDVNSMSYYGYTDNDCTGTTIASNILANPSLAVWTQPAGCCPDCINPLHRSDPNTYSPLPLMISAESVNPTTPAGSDGYINISVLDGGFTPAGQPMGFITGVANYTYVLRNQDPTDDMMSQTAGKAVSSGAVSSTGFTFGHSVAATNNNGGLIQTGAAGTTTITTSAAQGYVPGGSDIGTGAISEGLKAGTYDVFVFDSSTTVCLARTTVNLQDPSPVAGCTDSNALNFNSLATVANNTTCHYCDASTGELVDGNTPAVIVAPINTVSGSPFNILTYPTHTTATNTVVDISGLSPTTQFQAYINDVVSASGAQNANYIVSLHKWTTQSSSGSYAASSTIGTITSNTGSGWNVTLSNSTLGAGLTYGYYSIKISISDPDATVEIEQCYEIIDFIIPVPACVDAGVATAQDGVIVSDANLYFHDQTICNLGSNTCCNVVHFTANHINDYCSVIKYKPTITCPLATYYHEITLQYYDNGSWVDVPGTTLDFGNINNSSITYPNTWTPGFIFTFNHFVINGSGGYRVKWTSIIPNNSACTLYSNAEQVTFGVYGCTDSSVDQNGNQALNYNPLATCPEACVWCIYGCTTPGYSNYDPNATCDDGSCIGNVYGCTDPTASNYNPLATQDDGSCVYNNCGCTDAFTYNWGVNCAGQVVASGTTPPPCDDGCCLYCDDPAMTYTSATVAATTTLIPSGSGFYCQSNSDGCIKLTVSSTTCTGQWELFSCTTYCGISQSYNYWITPGNYDYDVEYSFCNLPAGCYTFTIYDCNGCELIFDVCVPSVGNVCGCTDPAAINYNAGAIYDDGSCEYCGCTDENAINYNPQATQNCIPDTCEYPSLLPPCIPPNIDQTIRRLETCIAENGFDYYNKLVTGQADDCSIMNVWKLMLMAYLLKRKGLDCIYNCADANTPNPADVYKSCDEIWVTGGPSTGLNDSAVTGTGVGTTSTVTLFAIGGTGELTPGDVIKHHISGNIWIFYGPGQNGTPTPVSVAGLDPENASGSISGYWAWCNDAMKYTSNNNNINYIDNFITFANKFCRDCGNDPRGLTGSASNLNIPIIQQGIDGIEDIEI